MCPTIRDQGNAISFFWGGGGVDPLGGVARSRHDHANASHGVILGRTDPQTLLQGC